MIKATGDGVILLGLSRGNVERLIAGDPIVFPGAIVGVPSAQFIIIFGETERAIAERLVASGQLPMTLMHAMRTILGPDWQSPPSGVAVEARDIGPKEPPKEPPS